MGALSCYCVCCYSQGFSCCLESFTITGQRTRLNRSNGIEGIASRELDWRRQRRTISEVCVIRVRDGSHRSDRTLLRFVPERLLHVHFYLKLLICKQCQLLSLKEFELHANLSHCATIGWDGTPGLRQQRLHLWHDWMEGIRSVWSVTSTTHKIGMEISCPAIKGLLQTQEFVGNDGPGIDVR